MAIDVAAMREAIEPGCRKWAENIYPKVEAAALEFREITDRELSPQEYLGLWLVAMVPLMPTSLSRDILTDIAARHFDRT